MKNPEPSTNSASWAYDACPVGDTVDVSAQVSSAVRFGMHRMKFGEHSHERGRVGSKERLHKKTLTQITYFDPEDGSNIYRRNGFSTANIYTAKPRVNVDNNNERQ